MKFKGSKFNFWSFIEEKRYLLFNGMTGALYEVDEEESFKIRELLEEPEKITPDSDDLSFLLWKGGFIIPAERDEIQRLVNLAKEDCIWSPILELILSPTYDCNFRCKYCYVDHKSERISQDIEIRILRYIERVLNHFRQINISWFGGEPLLCLDTILRMSKEIRKIARRWNVPFLNFISTNGYLLDLKTIIKLFDAGVKFFHITIDGSPSYHDQLRSLPFGHSTYERIWRNFMDLLRNIPDAQVTLRMNVNDGNIDSTREVLDDIPLSFRGRIYLNITPIGGEDIYPSKELYRKINAMTRYAIENGFLYYDNRIPVNKTTFCLADKYNNFQIGPMGQLYKCSPTKDKKEVFVGWLNEDGVPEFNKNYEKWHNAEVLKEICFECPYLCFCRGGCRLDRLRGVQDFRCQENFYDLENLIINKYLAISKNIFKRK